MSRGMKKAVSGVDLPIAVFVIAALFEYSQTIDYFGETVNRA